MPALSVIVEGQALFIPLMISFREDPFWYPSRCPSSAHALPFRLSMTIRLLAKSVIGNAFFNIFKPFIARSPTELLVPSYPLVVGDIVNHFPEHQKISSDSAGFVAPGLVGFKLMK